jgi:TPR repeat protein
MQLNFIFSHEKYSLDLFVRGGEISAMNKSLLPLVLLFLSLTCFGFTPTTEQIKEWRQQADQGDAVAQFNLGLIYANGYGVPEDDVEAVKWYRKAAEQGQARAQSNLGVMYLSGEGVPEDCVVAYMWCNLAAAQGYEGARSKKVMASIKMTKEQIAEAQKLSRDWLAKHSK